MAVKIFEAEKMNWGLCTCEDWQFTHYFVYDNGKVIRTVKGGENCFEKRKIYSKLDQTKLTRLKMLLTKLPEQEMGAGCDGEGWEMKVFDAKGAIIAQKWGYIYGIKLLEQIARILEDICMQVTCSHHLPH